MSDLKRILIASTRAEVGRLGTTPAASATTNSLLRDLAVLRKRNILQIALTDLVFAIAAASPFIFSLSRSEKDSSFFCKSPVWAHSFG